MQKVHNNSMFFNLKNITMVMVASLLLSFFIPVVSDAHASEVNNSNNNVSVEQGLDKFKKVDPNSIENVLQKINDVNVDGKDANQQDTSLMSATIPATQQLFSFWGCSYQIGVLVVSSAFPIGKILKIKRLIKDLGGVAKAFKIIKGATFASEKFSALGKTAETLVKELSGFSDVYNACVG